jgi:hypothetical protein
LSFAIIGVFTRFWTELWFGYDHSILSRSTSEHMYNHIR